MNTMRKWLYFIFALCAASSLVASTSPNAYADRLHQLSCSKLLESDLAYSASNIQDDPDQGQRFALPDGPIDVLMTDVFSGLGPEFVDRLRTGFIIEFITYCRGNSDKKVSEAIAQSQANLRLNTTSRNWGMKEIDVNKLLAGTCEAFVLHIQEHGIGAMFYNDPVRITFDAFWTRFDLNDDEFAKVQSVEGDAQFTCSLEPERILIDVLDNTAANYQLTRTR